MPSCQIQYKNKQIQVLSEKPTSSLSLYKMHEILVHQKHHHSVNTNHLPNDLYILQINWMKDKKYSIFKI